MSAPRPFVVVALDDPDLQRPGSVPWSTLKMPAPIPSTHAHHRAPPPPPHTRHTPSATSVRTHVVALGDRETFTDGDAASILDDAHAMAAWRILIDASDRPVCRIGPEALCLAIAQAELNYPPLAFGIVLDGTPASSPPPRCLQFDAPWVATLLKKHDDAAAAILAPYARTVNLKDAPECLRPPTEDPTAHPEDPSPPTLRDLGIAIDTAVALGGAGVPYNGPMTDADRVAYATYADEVFEDARRLVHARIFSTEVPSDADDDDDDESDDPDESKGTGVAMVAYCEDEQRAPRVERRDSDGFPVERPALARPSVSINKRRTATLQRQAVQRDLKHRALLQWRAKPRREPAAAHRAVYPTYSDINTSAGKRPSVLMVRQIGWTISSEPWALYDTIHVRRVAAAVAAHGVRGIHPLILCPSVLHPALECHWYLEDETGDALDPGAFCGAVAHPVAFAAYNFAVHCVASGVDGDGRTLHIHAAPDVVPVTLRPNGDASARRYTIAMHLMNLIERIHPEGYERISARIRTPSTTYTQTVRPAHAA